MTDGLDLARMRQEYEAGGIDLEQLDPDPMVEVQRWLEVAVGAELYEPNAMVVSTVDAEGQPWSRYVLLKELHADGLDFYTNYESHKSLQLTGNPRVAVTFGWLPLRRQVNLAGSAVPVPAETSDRYWSVRPRGSQLGGWASDQSRPLEARQDLLDRYAELDQHHDDPIPRPPHWGGWRVVPHTIELWQGRENRLHDRVRYSLDEQQRWHRTRLAP